MRRAITLLCSVIKLLSFTSECKLIFLCREDRLHTHLRHFYKRLISIFLHVTTDITSELDLLVHELKETGGLLI